MLELAALLGEGALAVVDPLVAVDLGSLSYDGGRSDDLIDLVLL